MPFDINVGEYVHRAWFLTVMGLALYIVGRVRHNKLENARWSQNMCVVTAVLFAFVVICYHFPAFCGTDVNLDPNDCIRDSLDTDWFIVELVATLMCSWLVVYEIWCSTERQSYGSKAAGGAHAQQQQQQQPGDMSKQTSICVFVCFFVHTAFMGVSWVWAEGDDETRFVVYTIGMGFQFTCVVIASLVVCFSRGCKAAVCRTCRSWCGLRGEYADIAPTAVLLQRDVLPSDAEAARHAVVPDPELSATPAKRSTRRKRTPSLMVDASDVRMKNIAYHTPESKDEQDGDIELDGAETWDSKDLQDVPLPAETSSSSSPTIEVPRNALLPLDSPEATNHHNTRHTVIVTMQPKPMPSLVPVIVAGVCVAVSILLNVLERLSLVKDDPIHYSPIITYMMHYVQHVLVLVALLLCANFVIEKEADVVTVSEVA